MHEFMFNIELCSVVDDKIWAIVKRAQLVKMLN